MDIREKLVELLEEIDATADEDCGIDKYTGGRVVSVHGAEYIADHLIANGVTVQEWIPVTERLPKPNESVLCWWESFDGEKEHYGFARYQNHGVWYVSNEGMRNVTHWMPLPQPPKGE